MKKLDDQTIIIKKLINYAICIILLCATLNGINCTAKNKGWNQVSEILNHINPPIFKNINYYVTDYGAIGDGKYDCTTAFTKAINRCYESGGGRVVVPEGKFLSGAIHLKSNVNLHISKNATVLFFGEPERYLPAVYTRFEGIECYNYSPFIYAYKQENIALTGSGTLDGQADVNNWWIWKGREEYGWKEGLPNGNLDTKKLYQMPEENIPVSKRIFGKDHYLRTNFVQFYNCQNILIDSVKLIRSPMWVIHPVLCENVTIQNVNVLSHGPNNDGCNPESSKNVLIKNCTFNTGDDCIAIKSGRNSDGRRINVASENIIVQGCTMVDGHGGVVIGSEMSGDVRTVFIQDCLMDSPNLERALRIKTNSLRGGTVENIYMRNCTIGEVSDAVIRINFAYAEGDVGNFTPIVRNIYVDNIKSKKSKYAIYLDGYQRSPISNIFIKDCEFKGLTDRNSLNHYVNLNLYNVHFNDEYVDFLEL